MAISIEKELTEMNLDIDLAIRLFFSLKYALLYRLGLDGISACFCSSTLTKEHCGHMDKCSTRESQTFYPLFSTGLNQIQMKTY